MHANLQQQCAVIWEELHPAQIIVQPISGFLIWSSLEGDGGGVQVLLYNQENVLQIQKEVLSLKYSCHSEASSEPESPLKGHRTSARNPDVGEHPLSFPWT